MRGLCGWRGGRGRASQLIGPGSLERRELRFEDALPLQQRVDLFAARRIHRTRGARQQRVDRKAQIAARIDDYKNRRIASQPKNRRSAGSIFKNPQPGVSDKKAWQLIDAAGLIGIRQGGAEISAEHCNFIVNDGSATAADVTLLIQLIAKRVLEETGVTLEREVVLVGFPPGL